MLPARWRLSSAPVSFARRTKPGAPTTEACDRQMAAAAGPGALSLLVGAFGVSCVGDDLGRADGDKLDVAGLGCEPVRSAGRRRHVGRRVLGVVGSVTSDRRCGFRGDWWRGLHGSSCRLTMGSVLEVVDAVELGIQLERPDFCLRFSMRCGWRDRPIWRFARRACLRVRRQVWGTDRARAAVVEIGSGRRSCRW
jgi:hypothetical protein